MTKINTSIYWRMEHYFIRDLSWDLCGKCNITLYSNFTIRFLDQLKSAKFL